MADELGLMKAWIYSVLSSDSTLTGMLASQPATVGNPGIFSGSAKQGAKFPAIIFRWITPIGEGDLKGNAGQRIWTRAEFHVVAVDQREDFEALSPIASRIDDLMNLGSGTPSGGLVIACFRESPYERALIDAGLPFRELGAMWDITARATA